MKVGELLRILEGIYPPAGAMAGDPIGVQVGDLEARARGILVALDADEPAVRAARRVGANVIVSHHPIWWKPPRLLAEPEPTGAGARAALRAGIHVLAAHTNADFATGGLCDEMVSVLGLLDPAPLSKADGLDIGRVGNLLAQPWARFLGRVKAAWGPGVRWAGVPPARVRRVAVCSGSGSDLARHAFADEAEVLVTGDVKYHAARDAECLGGRARARGRGKGFVLVDAGHFETERVFAARTARRLRSLVAPIPVTAWNPRGPFRNA